MSEGKTRDVEKLLGDPKKAIIMMMIPIVVAMVFQSLNSVINSVWVTGLGPGALAAVGIVFPLFFIILAIGNGIGVGASQTIAMHIGMEDKEGANKSAAQAIMLTFVTSAALAIILSVFARPLLSVIGGAPVIEECLEYALPLLICSPIIMLSALCSNLLRSEGAAKRSMYIQILGAVINLAIDPFIIYGAGDTLFGFHVPFGLGWGIAGAAMGTVISMGLGALVAIYWFKIKKDTYLNISLRGFRFDKKIDKMIFRVGIPASAEMMVISVIMVLMNVLLEGVGGADAVAMYTSSWRILNILMIPLMASGGAMVPVCAAAYGARRFDRVKDAYRYTFKLVLAMMLVISAITALTAGQMAAIFSYTESTYHLRYGMTLILYVGCVFMPFASWGATASAFFQSLGMGSKSLICTMIRYFVQLPVCAFLAGSGDLDLVWWGVAIGQIVGSVVAGLWGESVLRNFLKMSRKYRPPEEEPF